MTTTNFIDLQLDKETGDLLFIDGDLVLVQTNLDSLWQRLSLRFSIWLGEWQFNLDYGFPYASLLGKKTPKEVVDAAIKTSVFKEPDVLRIEGFESSFNKETRSYEAYFTVITTELESVNIAYLGTQYIYPTPEDTKIDMCPSYGEVIYGQKLYHLINFRLPVWGDLTWINKWH
ncbi:hypothetical protein V3429_02235 [Aeromonas jandaei]|uniref:hypothetical protein n=1 Tax=Aeromonas jandaei TaxID=650 RepID=UPI0030CCB323